MPKASNPTAIFVHGAGGGGWEWTIWRRVFGAHGWSAPAPDLQACPAGLAATRIGDYAAQVRAWCGASTGPYALIGASLGGLLAMLVAPESMPAALVLINPISPAGIESRRPRAQYPDIVPWGRDRSIIGTRRALSDADDATCLLAFRRWRDESGAVLTATASGLAVETPRCPVLVLASERDDDVPPEASRALALRLGADFHLIRGASHVGPLLGQRAANIAEGTLRWCAAHLGSAPVRS